jgi:glycosyltransferase involved in cell wall biosynthesis
MRKVVFFISSISKAGGSERACLAIANKLAALDYKITVVSFYGNQPFFEIHPAIHTVYLYPKKKKFKLILPLVVWNLRRKIRETDPDILINVDAALFAYSLIATIGLNIKNIVWEHFNYHVSLNSLARSLSRRLAAKYSRAIVTLTLQDKKNWEDNLNCCSPVITINNPSPFGKQNVNLAKKQPIVLAVGRLAPQKGFDRLLDVWAIVSKQALPGWKLRIVGSGELEPELSVQIKNKGLTGSVELCPVTGAIDKHYLEGAVYAMTSRFEGFPMVLLEAQSFGLPLVAYNCPTGPSEIINAENGLLIDDDDKVAMAEALISLINDPDKRATLSQGSLAWSSRYQIDVIIERWLKLLENI